MIIISSVMTKEIEQYSLLKFRIDGKQQIKEMIDLGLTLDSGPITNNSIEVIVNQVELKKLQKTSLNFEVVIEDMATFYKEKVEKSQARLEVLEILLALMNRP